MKYMPDIEKCPLPFSPFKSCTVPRPIGWLSSISPEGVENLAPYSQWQNLTFDPPMVMFAANQYPDGRKKDTVINAEKTGWFVWNMATWDLREAMNISSMALPYGESEIERAGLTTIKADLSDVPMIAESPCHFECKYIATHHIPGNSEVGTIDIVYAQVMKIHIKDEFITPDGKLDIKKIRPIARMGYYDYAVIEDTFEMRIPEASDLESAGLEGRSW
ncbi:flavin reductase family protein [Moraxella catarrhalis]|uniref:Flavin reductase-like, FMN-binding domain protein n=1 Tax=Moraxella catarrhalis TaxID=480 RepID=A0A198UJP5_MORCA|nr:flavin reductase family protein [Moraxella catarrhalis]OAU96121.1 Flavin reductase-like, FMN-binding domain protein [Moraxella catarrhalis]OAU96555.1 Flavin reductase-like, FMN-binding domain protein [Moraxella catarrhalis]OAU99065.1 Flavin reductase-like, FMN-binding domain protein [Moraxella catarrhalis]